MIESTLFQTLILTLTLTPLIICQDELSHTTELVEKKVIISLVLFDDCGGFVEPICFGLEGDHADDIGEIIRRTAGINGGHDC
jgi:hypothetical protein